jgi:hypothetical protein
VLLAAVINFGASFVVYPLFGFTFSASQNLGIVATFTVIALIRGYIVRRWFNAQLHAAAEKLAQEMAKAKEV